MSFVSRIEAHVSLAGDVIQFPTKKNTAPIDKLKTSKYKDRVVEIPGKQDHKGNPLTGVIIWVTENNMVRISYDEYKDSSKHPSSSPNKAKVVGIDFPLSSLKVIQPRNPAWG